MSYCFNIQILYQWLENNHWISIRLNNWGHHIFARQDLFFFSIVVRGQDGLRKVKTETAGHSACHSEHLTVRLQDHKQRGFLQLSDRKLITHYMAFWRNFDVVVVVVGSLRCHGAGNLPGCWVSPPRGFWRATIAAPHLETRRTDHPSDTPRVLGLRVRGATSEQSECPLHTRDWEFGIGLRSPEPISSKSSFNNVLIKFHQPRLVIRTFHHQGRCSRGGHLCNEHSPLKNRDWGLAPGYNEHSEDKFPLKRKLASGLIKW